MTRYPDRTPRDTDQLSPHEGFVQSTLGDYRYTDHPLVWTPTRTLYAAYSAKWAEIAASPYSAFALDDAPWPDRLTPDQFGTMLSRIFPDYPRVKYRISGVQARGIGGIVGPGSRVCRGYAEYPIALCNFPPPSDWTPANVNPKV